MSTSYAQANLPLFEERDTIGVIADGSENISGICQSILYAHLGTGFTIAELKLSDFSNVVVMGRGDPFSPGDRVECEGHWEIDGRFGKKFRAKYLRSFIPETPEGIARYIASGAVPGIGAKTAERLLKTFGNSLPEALQHASMLMAAGFPESKANALTEHWKIRTRHGRLLSFLYSVGAGPSVARRLLETYGDEVYRILLSDPYRPAREIPGIGFRTADRMALSQGVKKDSPARIQAAIFHELNDIEREGHCASPRLGLISRVSRNIMVPLSCVEREVDSLLSEGKIVEETIEGRPVIWRASVHQAEVEVARLLVAMIGPSHYQMSVDYVAQTAEKLGFPILDGGQIEAIRLAATHRVSIITGSPGTGKTLTISVLLRCLQSLNPNLKIMLAAPTGRAAKRMSEQTGMEAFTIHRLLAWSPLTGRPTKGPDQPLDCDFIVIDETSMLDIFLFRDLLRALPPDCHIVFVGDVDQLPSVGAGAVLFDMICSKTIPVARLTRIFRQGAGSRIAAVSQHINSGKVPHINPPRSGSDMWACWVSQPQEAAETVIHLATQKIPAEGFDPRRDLQVLTPGHQGDVGVSALNKALQNCINPRAVGKPEISWKDRLFRLGDRVIQTANSYELEVFNGDIGFIVDILDDQTILVDFDGKTVRYEGSDLNNLHLAYAITIHKSQGSEFPAVILLCTTQHFVMLYRNLLYTGVSRARRLCVLVGQQKAVFIAAKKSDSGRITGLASRLFDLAKNLHK